MINFGKSGGSGSGGSGSDGGGSGSGSGWKIGASTSLCLTRCVALRFENLSTSSRYFSELKDLSLDDLAM